MTSTISTSRNDIRQSVRALRKSLTTEIQQQQAVELSQRLSTYNKLKKAENIAIYLSNDGEIDTKPLINWCWQQGKEVYLPVIHPFSAGHLLFLHYTPKTTLIKNKYRISEPQLDVREIINISSIDIMFTPLVAFDKEGNRLGMGGGFYDRTLRIWHEQYRVNTASTPYPIGVAHDCQQVESLPNEYWDIPLPEIFTPKKHHIF